eukprot:TRINITY_DN56143_c0_g1_i1.p1 TRINITY_DN56143_c0_g1~~TRINITY_DN56143_c0_g1_i1.p1  ORF type:complete len:694 (+),score=88.50 TRINITY_DN56143_c0_g1_i1:279-2084(+)
MSASAAMSMSACWSMLSFVSCMLGGYIADNSLGRYRTILYFAIVYAVGVALVSVSAVPSILSSTLCLPLYFVGAFIFVALGTGAIKPNVMNFGADQYDVSDSQEQAEQQKFFSFFYLTINLGVVVANGYCANLATDGATKDDPGTGYLKSYIIAAGSMALACFFFVAGTPRYANTGGGTRSHKVSVARQHLIASCKTSNLARLATLGWVGVPLSMILVLASSVLTAFSGGSDSAAKLTNAVTWGACGLSMLSCIMLIVAHLRNDYIVPLANLSQQAESIERDTSTQGTSCQDVRKAFGCIPLIVSVNMGFNILYNSMNNAYSVQACQMDTTFGGRQLNGAFFNLGDCFAIIVFVPLIEGLIFPAWTRARGTPPKMLTKFIWGFIFCILANVSAALLEVERRDRSAEKDFVLCPGGNSTLGECSSGYLLSKCSFQSSLPMTNMSAFWTFLPMILTGIGEILVNPVIYLFVYEQAPASLTGLIQALNLVFGGAVSEAVTAALSLLVPENLDEGHLVYFFYANIAFALVMLVLMFLAAFSGEAKTESAETTSGAIAATFLATESHGASLLGTSASHGASLLGTGTPHQARLSASCISEMPASGS